MVRGALGVVALTCAFACSEASSSGTIDTGLEDLAVTAVAPAALVPGTRVVVTGSSFVDDDWGVAELHLEGSLGDAPVDVRLPAEFVDYTSMKVDWPGGSAAGLPADTGTFVGRATLEVTSKVDGEVYSAGVDVTLAVAPELEPLVDGVSGGEIYINDEVVISGSGFLLGGDEGQTVAVLAGCYTLDTGGACDPIEPIELPARPVSAFDRTQVTFAFSPKVAGIRPGVFEGTITVSNRHGGGGAVDSGPSESILGILPPELRSFSPDDASLGQFVEIEGRGFTGGDPDDLGQVTIIRLTGSFAPDGMPPGPEVTVLLVPEFASGRLIRYVLAEDDELGQRLDLREVAGIFIGTATAVVRGGGDEITSPPIVVELGIEHVKQVVWINFLPSYVESLRHFGLRGADRYIRQRVLAVARRDFATINVEFREEEPTDFALYSVVDIAGPDVNGLGLLGYDNSPGKDHDNERLHDHVGGVNATTLENGDPGYGGVFVESFFGLSEHPGEYAERLDGADPVFDDIFDAFRPDRGSASVASADLDGFVLPTSGDGCPAEGGDRKAKLRCAVWVLGSMIGSTMTHEIGHSLGLANPNEEENYHNPGDRPNRLMDGGGSRSFGERAELGGEGPAMFCDEEYEYLRVILPTDEPPTSFVRPPCD